MKSVGQASSNLSLGGVISSFYMLNVHFQQFDICNSERTNLNLDIYNSERTRLFILPTVFSSLKLLTHSFNKGGEVKSEWRRNRTKGIVYVVEGDWVIGKERNDFRLRGVREM